MVRITVLKDGSVTGDVGRVVAYEGQDYSEPIHFTYPAMGDEYMKYVSYTWGNTVLENMLDYEDKVKLLIRGVGIVRIQFIAKHALTGENYFMSKPFELIVHKSLCASPDIFSNCYRSGCPQANSSPSSSCGGFADQMVKFGVELAEEQRVRASQDSLIWEEIYKIKDALAAAGINTYEPISTVEDCNLLLSAGEFRLKNGSLNTPEGPEGCESPWLLQVKRYTRQILQTAYSADDGATSISYRTGTIIDSDKVHWETWVPMIHETEITEV